MGIQDEEIFVMGVTILHRNKAFKEKFIDILVFLGKECFLMI
jgi:hypothetical protein